MLFVTALGVPAHQTPNLTRLTLKALAFTVRSLSMSIFLKKIWIGECVSHNFGGLSGISVPVWSGDPAKEETRPTQLWVACSAWVPHLSAEAIDKSEAYSEDSEGDAGEKKQAPQQPGNLLH